MLVGIGLPLHAQRGERLDGVFGSHLHQLAVFTVVGHDQLHLFAAAASAQPLLDDLGFFHVVGQQHLVGDVGGIGIELLDELLHDLRVGLVGSTFQDEILATNHLAAADEKDLHAGFAVGAGQGNHIRVHLLARNDALLFHHPVDGPQLVADLGSALEVQVFGGSLHLLAQAVDDRLGAPLQEAAQVVDHPTVFLLADRPNARPCAQLDIVKQAGTRILPGDVAVASQVREDAPHHVQRLVHRPGTGEGAKVARAVLHHVASDGHLGEGVGPMHLDVGVTLVVLELDVVTRAVFFDQVHLEDEGLEF